MQAAKACLGPHSIITTYALDAWWQCISVWDTHILARLPAQGPFENKDWMFTCQLAWPVLLAQTIRCLRFNLSGR